MARDGDPAGISPSPGPLNVLLVDDNPDDAELCRRTLNKHASNVQLDAVSTLQEFAERLQSSTYELVLSDYNLGIGTASDALSLLRKKDREIPFILVTGTIGEEKAVECIREGMADFILKDRLERLPVAITRALDEKKLREENRHAEHTLRESEAKFRALADAIPAAIFIEERGQLVYVNRAAEEISGYSSDELMALSFGHLVHPDSKDAVMEHQAKRGTSEQSPYRIEIMIQPRGREPRWLDITVGTFTRDGTPATLTTAFDVSERKRANQEIHLDPITGLPNHAHLLSVFDNEALRTKRTGRVFSVLVLSIEGLKQIAAKHGQLAAVQAFNRAARTTRLHCRNLDTVARIGAQQFALLLPETDIEGALTLGGRIAARLSSNGQELKLPCKFGVATHPNDGETLEEILNAANQQSHSGLKKMELENRK
jgi:PAS domain S-box-containing protein/diguanylate cyclase (GGDEF)-like protein